MHKFGDIDVLKYEDIATPAPKPGHILIKVLGAGVNRFEHYLREGSVTPELSFPHILGADAAGEVAKLGDGVTGFEIGERVVVVPGFLLNELRPFGSMCVFSPPLIITKGQIDTMVAIMRDSIEATIADLRSEGLWNG